MDGDNTGLLVYAGLVGLPANRGHVVELPSV